MSKGEFYRDKAAECAHLAQVANDPLRKRAYEDMQTAWLQLASRADWLSKDTGEETHLPAAATI